MDALRAALIEREMGLVAKGSVNEPTDVPAFRYAAPDQYNASLLPREALATFPFAVHTAITQLRRELFVARVFAIAHQTIWRNEGLTKEANYLVVPTWVWTDTELSIAHDFWDTGYLDTLFPMKGYSIDTSRWIRLYDIRFWPEGLQRGTATETPANVSQEVFAPSKGGRPPKPWWEDLWIEIGRQLYAGNLTPNRQVDIENAMKDWITGSGHSASERLIRDRARKLFDAIHSEGKK